MAMIIGVGILREPTPNNPIFIYVEWNLSSISYFKRNIAKEVLTFFIRECARRTTIGERRSVTNDDGTCHCWGTSSGLKIAILSIHNYPERVAFSLAMKVAQSFEALHPLSSTTITQDFMVESNEFSALIAQYQDPFAADPIEHSLVDLEEVQKILVSTLAELVERDGKLDDLLKKSNDLSENSKAFFLNSKNQNSCCILF